MDDLNTAPGPDENKPSEAAAQKRHRAIPFVIGIGVALVVAIGAALLVHSEGKVNKVALASAPKPVSVVVAKEASYRPTRMYVGRIDPWVSANVGPQLVSAFVDTVLVRPGAVVKRGQVLATLDCRNASATQSAIEMQARALDAQQKAMAHEADRTTTLLDGGFVSPNEAEQKNAQSASKEAELLSEKAKLLGSSLEVNDCILRAPFDGDVAVRAIDPGAFVRPGTTIVSVVDRSTVRMTADVPENDFDVVAPGRSVEIVSYATGKKIHGTITRRAPSADQSTRTVHVEVDIADPDHSIPVGTTGELHVAAGDPISAVEIPLASASLKDTKATIYLVDREIVHVKQFLTVGEGSGVLFVKSSDVPVGSKVVTEGRSLLHDGDRVSAKVESDSANANEGEKK